MPVQVMGALMVKIAIMILLGFVLKKRHVITQEFQSSLSGFLMSVVLPFSILAASNNEFSAAMAGRLGQAALISAAYYVVALAAGFLLSRAVFPRGPAGERKSRRDGIFVTMSVFANLAFIGLPVLKELYGGEAFLYGVIYNMMFQLFMFTVGTLLLSGEKNINFRVLARDPATLASVAAVLIYLSPLRFPAVIVQTFEQIGGMCVPISMIVIGCSMADVPVSRIWKERSAWLVSLLRLVVFPLVMLAVLTVLGVDAVLAASCVIMTAMPVGSLNVILSQKYQADVGYATTTVVQSMVLLFPTLPLVLFCIQKLLF